MLNTQEKIDTVKVLGAAAGATGVAIADVNQWLTFISLGVAICYTCWKWYRDYKKHQNG